MESNYIVEITPKEKLTTFRGKLVIKIESNSAKEAEISSLEALMELIDSPKNYFKAKAILKEGE